MLIPQPSYVSYLPCVTLAGGVPVVIELKAENEFRLTKIASFISLTISKNLRIPDGFICVTVLFNGFLTV